MMFEKRADEYSAQYDGNLRSEVLRPVHELVNISGHGGLKRRCQTRGDRDWMMD
jgi:hypothetical protein